MKDLYTDFVEQVQDLLPAVDPDRIAEWALANELDLASAVQDLGA